MNPGSLTSAVIGSDLGLPSLVQACALLVLLPLAALCSGAGPLTSLSLFPQHKGLGSEELARLFLSAVGVTGENSCASKTLKDPSGISTLVGGKNTL